MKKLTIWHRCSWPNLLEDKRDTRISFSALFRCMFHDTIAGMYCNQHLCHSDDTTNSMDQLFADVWLHLVHL